jgi:hypothetical protein
MVADFSVCEISGGLSLLVKFFEDECSFLKDLRAIRMCL